MGQSRSPGSVASASGHWNHLDGTHQLGENSEPPCLFILFGAAITKEELKQKQIQGSPGREMEEGNQQMEDVLEGSRWGGGAQRSVTGTQVEVKHVTSGLRFLRIRDAPTTLSSICRERDELCVERTWLEGSSCFAVIWMRHTF